MSQVLRNIVLSRGGFSLLCPSLPVTQRRRPGTFMLRGRWRSGTRTWIHCTSLLFPSNFMAKILIQSCTTVFTSHTLSLCEAIYSSRHPYWHPRNADTTSLPKWFVLFRITFRSINRTIRVQISLVSSSQCSPSHFT